jgi:hypothetical protein
MEMWAWDNNKNQLAYEASAGPIPERLLSENMFIFLGKYQPWNGIDYESVLNEFDKLLPLYQYVESHGKNGTVSVPLESNFAFRPGCHPKKRTAIVQLSQEQVQRELRHNELQRALFRRLAKRFGKDHVGTEVKGKHGTSIDLVVQHKHAFSFYEIKTASTARAFIREALGQILEYAFWPGAQEAARLIIAGECEIDREAKDYLRSLRQRFSLPLEYEQI